MWYIEASSNLYVIGLCPKVCHSSGVSHWTWVYVEASSNLYVIGHCPKVCHSSFVSLRQMRSSFGYLYITWAWSTPMSEELSWDRDLLFEVGCLYIYVWDKWIVLCPIHISCHLPHLSHWTWVYVEASSNLYVIGHCPKVCHSSFVSLDMGICRGKLQLICDRSLSQGVSLLICLIGHGYM